ncbi:sensor histidine kinase [Aquabacter spiritensis]|uniref:histidine kinase n=1 Tax=Aquabacter spiritensis TaxID=933073 RepID=A0A4R3M6L9_9HYPH|nr:ATP-binding protein [Aquabacter spiritensis]TCT07909.1 phospho-acceptor domain-containing protein [Aquabacter spiritensis]
MTSWLNSARDTLRVLPVALIATTICLFAATALLYVTESQRRALLSATIRSSGWVAYQAQLEYVKSRAAMDSVVMVPSQNALDFLGLRLELLRSRLPLLYSSEEGRFLDEIAGVKSGVQAFEGEIDAFLDRLPLLPADRATADEVLSWIDALEPLGRTLQTALLTSVAYNDEIFRRERELAATPAIVPLMLLFVSGTCLALVLLVQARRDRVRLAAVQTARAAVAAMEENLRGVIEAVPACMAVIDPSDRRVRFVNSGGGAMIDASPDHPDWARLTDAAFAAARLEGAQWGTLALTFDTAEGAIISLRGSLCNVIWEGRPQILMVLADTTRVRDADLQLLQAAKLATLGEMATAIAHELNQPLAVIRMAVANAHRMLASDGERSLIAAKLDRVASQVDRAKRIIDQVRRYGRLPTGRPTRFSLRHAVELAVGFVAEQYRAFGIRLSIQLDIPADLMVTGEQTMFEQVIVNLLINARDAFEARTTPGRAPCVFVRARVAGDNAVIEVEDDAGGIDNEMMSRLFEPFSTSKPVEKGTGLGLSLARSVVRDMNGQITGENIAEGARFTVVLPIASAPSAQEAA